MKKSLIILVTTLISLFALQANVNESYLYSGIYEGTYEEYSLEWGYESGIFLCYVDFNNNATLWVGNEYEADKYRFKLNAQGSGSFKSTYGYTVTVQFSPSGAISVQADKGLSVTVSTNKLEYPYTEGAADLLAYLSANPVMHLDLNYLNSPQTDPNYGSAEDQFAVLSGEWTGKFKVGIIDYGTINLSGDAIYLPNAVYLFAKGRGESLLVKQSASVSYDNDVYITSASYDFNKREISASGNARVQGYSGTVSYTLKQKVSYYDSDKDGLSDYEELNTYFTNPLKADSDGDRMSDYAEREAGTDPNDKSVYPAYLKVSVSLAKGIAFGDGDEAIVTVDGDAYPVTLKRGKGSVSIAMPTGSTYAVSASMGELGSGAVRSVTLSKAQSLSLVLDGDSDEDGLSDSLEARYKGDPNNPDTDGDGISDYYEVYEHKTKVDLADSDKDGLSDYEELNTYFTNPLKADSDGDRMSDYAEFTAGTDPNDKSVYPAYLKVSVSLAKGIAFGDGDEAIVTVDGDAYPVTLKRGKGSVSIAMPTGSTYAVSASMGELGSGAVRSVTLSKAQSLSLVLDGDSDEDGLSDSLEARYKGDPNNPDTDGDGISDYYEVYEHKTKVDLADSDKDGFTDKQELDLKTNPLSSKDKPSAYIERPVVVDWLLTYEAEDGYINEDWSTEQLASFLSAAAGDRQDAASIYLKYSLDGSNVKWIVRHEAGDIDVTSLMRPMKVSKPAQLDAVVMSPEAVDGSYYGAELFSLGISAGKTKSLSLVVGGESTFIQLGPNISGLDLDLAVASDYQVLGLMKDPQLSDGPILIEGILTLGDEVANVLGQVIGPVATGDTASTFN